METETVENIENVQNVENVENVGDGSMDTAADVVPGMKRPAGTPGSAGKGKKKRKTSGAGPPLPKNALMQLNEIKPGLIYNVVNQGGPVHNPQFTVAVEVNGQMFQGVANSKKKAKLNAAEQALASFVQLPNAAARAQTVATDGDFTGDDSVNNLEKNGDTKVEMVHQGIPMTKKQAPQQPAGKNPVMILNEVRPGTQYVALTDVASYAQTKSFIMEVTVDGKTFQGEGRNKKLAKARAAQSALKELFNLEFKMPEGSEPVHAGVSTTTDTISKHNVPPLADRVAKLVITKFSELTQGFMAQYSRRKVLAGVVMTVHGDLDSATVVCVTTGTKCVNGEYMSVSGLVLNDCHAEILARRCLRRFLFDQLQVLVETGNVRYTGDSQEKKKNQNGAGSAAGITIEDGATETTFVAPTELMAVSIFKPNPDAAVGGYQLKEGVEFHLYISTSPCGDARIFSPHESSKAADKHPNRKARGQLRTKIESGEGTIPITEDKIQTWDGIIQGGERLLTMSCSDKVSRWNVVGVQGALLGYFIEPIYFNSIILGSFYHSQHLGRAIRTRYGGLEDLPPPYHIHAPLLSGISNEESRQPGKASGFAVNWYLGNGEIEVITTMKGKTEQEKTSQICKFEMFKLFSGLYGKLTTRFGMKTDPLTEQYGDVKALQEEYQRAKKIFADKLKSNQLGFWVCKPREQDEFTMGDSISAMESMIAAMQHSIEQMKKGGQVAGVKPAAESGSSPDLTGIATMFTEPEVKTDMNS